MANSKLIAEGDGILTHCNAGALATSELGTATAVMYLAYSRGRESHVYADETRPLLQGACHTACPSSTIDRSTADGSGIIIEERDPEEVTSFGGMRTAPEEDTRAGLPRQPRASRRRTGWGEARIAGSALQKGETRWRMKRYEKRLIS
jgi:methylthioribose-1-phosphate isomerase